MHVHVLQHVPFEGLGSIQTWLQTNRAEVTWTRVFEQPDFPAPEAPDLLIALGGPMSVNDEAQFPWLKPEKQFIREVIAAATPMLGICLGAQLIASANGARVFPGNEPEIGWFPVFGDQEAGSRFALPQEMQTFHWHGETFDLPPDAVRLAHSSVCANQGFMLGDNVIGVQFHLETTAASAGALLDNCADEIQPGRTFIQSEDTLRATPTQAYEQINTVMSQLLDYLTQTRAAEATVPGY